MAQLVFFRKKNPSFSRQLSVPTRAVWQRRMQHDPKARPTKDNPRLERSEFMPLERDPAFV